MGMSISVMLSFVLLRSISRFPVALCSRLLCACLTSFSPPCGLYCRRIIRMAVCHCPVLCNYFLNVCLEFHRLSVCHNLFQNNKQTNNHNNISIISDSLFSVFIFCKISLYFSAIGLTVCISIFFLIGKLFPHTVAIF